jgi:hypothetical protein
MASIPEYLNSRFFVKKELILKDPRDIVSHSVTRNSSGVNITLEIELPAGRIGTERKVEEILSFLKEPLYKEDDDEELAKDFVDQFKNIK